MDNGYGTLIGKVTVRELLAMKWFRVQAAIGILLTLIAIPVAYWAADNEWPYTFDVSNSYIEPPSVEAGRVITVHWKAEKNRECQGAAQRVLFDPDSKLIVATYDPNLTAPQSSYDENSKTLRRAVQLPERLPKGVIGYRAYVWYQCNPLQRFLPLRTVTPDLFFVVK